jgi:lysine 2,3-aminomutase
LGQLIQEQADAFRFAVTPYYLGLARPEDPNCPILAQVLPRGEETNDDRFPDLDPLAEENNSPLPGLTHRYPDRVLWYLTHRCAVYCRFCLRKRKVSRSESAPARSARAGVLEYVRSHPEIKEVILSGGDPLALGDDDLDHILGELRTIEHLVSIRIHSRMPVTLPMRFTPELLAVLNRHYPLTLVAHFNHAAELSPQAVAAVRALRMHGVHVLNQAVLLKGVNDSIESQEALHLGLLRAGVKPYYLHQCDEVRGVSHFRVPIERGLEIMGALRGRNPGIALPRYVLDLAGGGGKVPLEPEYFLGRATDAQGEVLIFRNWAGKEYRVRP